MPLYANPPPFVWHKIDTHTTQYSALPLFVPPTPPILVVPHNPFLPRPPDPSQDPPPQEPETHAAEDAPPEGDGDDSLLLRIVTNDVLLTCR